MWSEKGIYSMVALTNFTCAPRIAPFKLMALSEQKINTCKMLCPPSRLKKLAK